MMEKRLRLARRLLKPDGVLICTIDEHEVNHLGMLLEKTFPRHLHYMVTIVINPKGREKANFAPVDEFALFVVPDTGDDIILRSPSAMPARPHVDDIDNEEAEEEIESDKSQKKTIPLTTRRMKPRVQTTYGNAATRGAGAAGLSRLSYREKRPNQFYPIYINEETKTVIRVGASIPSRQVAKLPEGGRPPSNLAHRYRGEASGLGICPVIHAAYDRCRQRTSRPISSEA